MFTVVVYFLALSSVAESAKTRQHALCRTELSWHWPCRPHHLRKYVLSPYVVDRCLCGIGLWYASRTRSGDFGGIRLPETESARLMTDHVPAALHFSGISYQLGNHLILDDISGSVKPGQLLAIMGASGAGKSTFLDILARKNKRGIVTGRTLVNGREVRDSDFKKVMGFVDQEDTLMSTLTVYETVLYSALLRLPREMSLEAKKFRTLETLHELGILSIKDSRIGSSGAYMRHSCGPHAVIRAHLSSRSSLYIWWREASCIDRLRTRYQPLYLVPG